MTSRHRALLGLLPIVAGVLIGAYLLYCTVWWTPHPMGITDPDCSFSCWGYCATQNPFWGALAGLLVSGSCVGGVLILLRRRSGLGVSLILGVLTLPTGALAGVPFLVDIWYSRNARS